MPRSKAAGLHAHANLHTSHRGLASILQHFFTKTLYNPPLYHTVCICVYVCVPFGTEQLPSHLRGLIHGPIKSNNSHLNQGENGKTRHNKGNLFKDSKNIPIPPSSQGFYKLLSENYSCKRSLPICLRPVCRAVGFS